MSGALPTGPVLTDGRNEHPQFAMLNDLTDCLRIGDVTVFGKLDQESAPR
ncbi:MULTISPECIES: hypothetical protein [unclassified Streptomyces]